MDMHPFEGPTVRRRRVLEVALALRECEEEARLAAGSSGKEELQTEHGFPGARLALYEVDLLLRQPALENPVQTLDAGGDLRGPHQRSGGTGAIRLTAAFRHPFRSVSAMHLLRAQLVQLSRRGQ